MSVALELKYQVVERCPVCGSLRRANFWTKGTMNVIRCLDCAVSYLDPCLSSESMAALYHSEEFLKEMNEFHAGYYEYGNVNDRSVTVKGFNRCLDLIEKYHEGSMKNLFEAGYGSGLFLGIARKRGWLVDGIDTSVENAELAKRKFDLQLRTGYFESVSEKEVSCHALVMMDVLEHIAQPRNLLEKAHQLLKPQGILLVGVPNENSMLQLLGRVLCGLSGGRIDLGMKKVYIWEHVCYYNRRTLSDLLRKNGFAPILSFQESTDLARFNLGVKDLFMAYVVLLLGKLFGMQNKLLVLARKV